MTPGTVMAAEIAKQPSRLEALLSRADVIAGQVREALPDPLAMALVRQLGRYPDHPAGLHKVTATWSAPRGRIW